MRWVWRGFCAGLPSEGASGEHVDEREGREVRVRWTRCVPDTIDELLPEADRAPARLETGGDPGAAGAGLRAAQAGARGVARAPGPAGQPAELLRASRPTAAAATASTSSGCFGLPGVDPPPGVEAPSETGLPPLVRGSLVHELLERAGLPPAACAERRRGRRAHRGHGQAGPARGRGGPARPRRGHGRLRPARAARPRPEGPRPSCPSPSRSPRPAPAAAACSWEAWSTCTPPRTAGRWWSTGRATPSTAATPASSWPRPTSPSG